MTDGAAGHESQAIAVAESVGLPFSVRRVRVKGAMRFLPPALQIHLPARTLLGAVDHHQEVERGAAAFRRATNTFHYLLTPT